MHIKKSTLAIHRGGSFPHYKRKPFIIENNSGKSYRYHRRLTLRRLPKWIADLQIDDGQKNSAWEYSRNQARVICSAIEAAGNDVCEVITVL